MSVLVILAAALPQVAAAQDDGVFFDPGGTSDKEYAVPHEEARTGGGTPSPDPGGASDPGGSSAEGGTVGTEGSSGGGTGSGDPANPPLFGEGVSPKAAGKRGTDGEARTPTGTDRVVGISRASADTSTATGLGWLAVIAAGVALAGGGLAYLLRGRGAA